jgi:hypothetical protein
MERHDIDLDELVLTSELTLEFLKSKGLDGLKCSELLYGIYQLSQGYIQSGLGNLDILFDATEVCIASENPKKDYESAKDFVKSHQKNLNAQLQKYQSDYYEFLKKKKCPFFVFIDSTVSEGKHRSNFFINLSRINENNKISDINNDISYKTSNLPKPLPWAKPFLNLEITGWRLFSFISFPIVMVLYFLILVLWNLYGYSTLSFTFLVLSIFVVASFFHWIYPIYEAMDKRVGMAPFWMMNVNLQSAQLRAKKLGKKRKNGKQYRTLELVIYKADCPICGNKVSVVAGKGEFKRRLIGECDESPREHAFSFDHVTKKGRKLL